MAAISPYETALVLGHAKPTYTIAEEDTERVTAYDTYEDIYRNAPGAFAAILRDADGEEISRRYVAGARTIIEGTNRYLGKNLTWVSEVPLDVTISADDAKATMDILKALFAREQFGAKFLALKRWFLIRGDALLHVSADPLKPEGSRIRISELLPGHYFPILDQVDTSRVIGCYISQVIFNDDQEEIVQRIEYRRMVNEEMAAQYGAPLGSIFYRLSFWEIDGWDDRWPLSDEDLKQVENPSWAVPPEGGQPDPYTGFALPPDITAIPVYHFRNNRDGERVWGVSELQGTETLLGGQTQVMTDQDIAVALQGIGVFYTDSGRPRTATGEETEWVISPAAMLEVEQGSKVGRVDGGNIESMMSHYGQLGEAAREATGTPDVAVGRVGVEVAESGIALAIQFAPVISKGEEKEEELAGKLDQMVYDLLNGWLPAYEGLAPNGLIIRAVFGDPLPVNREAIVKEVTELVKAKVISRQQAAKIIKEKLGYDIDPALMVAETDGEDAASLDAVGQRTNAELDGAV